MERLATILALFIGFLLISPPASSQKKIDMLGDIGAGNDIEKETMLYQIEVSENTIDRLEEIFNNFQESFIDYTPALDKINVVMIDYSNAMQNAPTAIPEKGKKLDELMKKLLSRMEKYYVYYKRFGRKNMYISVQIYEVMAEISQEKEDLVFQYM